MLDNAVDISIEFSRRFCFDPQSMHIRDADNYTMVSPEELGVVKHPALRLENLNHLHTSLKASCSARLLLVDGDLEEVGKISREWLPPRSRSARGTDFQCT